MSEPAPVARTMSSLLTPGSGLHNRCDNAGARNRGNSRRAGRYSYQRGGAPTQQQRRDVRAGGPMPNQVPNFCCDEHFFKSASCTDNDDHRSYWSQRSVQDLLDAAHTVALTQAQRVDRKIFHADAGKTIFYAIIVGLPTGLLAGPVFALLVSRWITTGPKHGAVLAAEDIADIPAHEVGAKHHAKGIDSAPSMGTVLTTVLLPPVLMMSRSVADAFLPADNAARIFFDFVGDPIVALLIALFFAIYALGLRQGDDMGRIQEILNRALGPISCGDRHCRCRRRI